MSWKDNFYFYFSIFSLLFIFILIYFFYEMDYKLSNFIDIKTILTVLGTVFGAYFGAKTAGKFAIASVEKQIESNYKKENEKSKKTITIIRSEIYMFRKYLVLYLEMKEDKKTGLRQLYSLSQDGVKKRAIKLENTMNNVNWMYIPIDEFIMMTAIKEIVNNILYDVESIERNINIADNKEDFSYLWDITDVWKSYNEDLIGIESRLDEIII